MKIVAPFAPDVSGEFFTKRYRLIARYCEFFDNLELGRVSNSEEANLYSDIGRNVACLSWESSENPLGASCRSFHEGLSELWWLFHDCGHSGIVQSFG